MAQGICHVDVNERKLLSVNRQTGVMESVEISSVETMMQAIETMFPNDEAKKKFRAVFNYNNLFEAYAKGEMSFTLDTEMRKKDGSIMPVRFLGRLVSNPTNNHLECIGFNYDISEEVRLRREIDMTNKLNNALACEYSTIFSVNLQEGIMRHRS